MVPLLFSNTPFSSISNSLKIKELFFSISFLHNIDLFGIKSPYLHKLIRQLRSYLSNVVIFKRYTQFHPVICNFQD